MSEHALDLEHDARNTLLFSRLANQVRNLYPAHLYQVIVRTNDLEIIVIDRRDTSINLHLKGRHM